MKLKNDFSVFGSASLRKALSEELVNLSLGDNGACTASDNNILLKVYDNGSFTNNLDRVFVTEKVFYLPQDWDKALAAAQDYEEVWPKYGKFISPELKHLTENKIYKLTREINIGMSDHCYEFINDLGGGDTAHITHFEIVHEEGYLKQEAEPKVGDYIYFLKDISYKHQGDIVKIDRLDKDSYNGKAWIKYENDGFRWGGNGYQLGVDFRKATEEEIKKAQEIKVGDMVIALQQVSYLNKGGIAKIYSIGGDLVRFSHKQDNKDFVSSKHIYECFRKATPQEVKNYEEIKVSGYQAEVMNGKIAFGCQHLSKQTLQELNGVACYVDITIGDTKITQDLLTKLLNKL